MRREERTRAMDALKNDPSCEVLLVSLKAGGVGLNLTAAQRVYLMDPYWYIPLHLFLLYGCSSFLGILPSRTRLSIELCVSYLILIFVEQRAYSISTASIGAN